MNAIPSKKKVVIVVITDVTLEAGLERGGGIQNVDYHVSECLSKKYNVEIISPYYKRFIPRTEINDKFCISRVPIPAIDNYPPINQRQLIYHAPYYIPYSLYIIRKLLKISKNSQIILLLHNSVPSLIISLLSKLFGFKSIMFEGNLKPWCDPQTLSTRKSPMDKVVSACCDFVNLFSGLMVAKLSDCVVVQSILIEKGMVDHYISPSKIEVIPVGFDKSINDGIINNGKCSKINMKVAFIGRLVREKGAEMLVDVVKMAETQIPNLQFLIFGDGEYRSKLENRSNVVHLGWLSKEKMFSKMLDVPVVIFFQRSIGLAELECMAAAKVVIACNRGDVSQTIKNNVTGILCEPKSQQYLEAMSMIFSDHNLLASISINAQNYAINNCSWEKIGDLWFSIIDSTIRGANK